MHTCILTSNEGLCLPLTYAHSAPALYAAVLPTYLSDATCLQSPAHAPSAPVPITPRTGRFFDPIDMFWPIFPVRFESLFDPFDPFPMSFSGESGPGNKAPPSRIFAL